MQYKRRTVGNLSQKPLCVKIRNHEQIILFVTRRRRCRNSSVVVRRRTRTAVEALQLVSKATRSAQMKRQQRREWHKHQHRHYARRPVITTDRRARPARQHRAIPLQCDVFASVAHCCNTMGLNAGYTLPHISNSQETKARTTGDLKAIRSLTASYCTT